MWDKVSCSSCGVYLRSDLLLALTANRTLAILEQLTYGLLVLLGHGTLWGLTQRLNTHTENGRGIWLITNRLFIRLILVVVGVDLSAGRALLGLNVGATIGSVRGPSAS